MPPVSFAIDCTDDDDPPMENVTDSADDQESNADRLTRIVEDGNAVDNITEERGLLNCNVMESSSSTAIDSSRIKTALENSLNSHEVEDGWPMTDVHEKVPYFTLTYLTLQSFISFYTNLSFCTLTYLGLC